GLDLRAVAEPVDRHPRARRGEAACEREPDARRAAGDERGAAGKEGVVHAGGRVRYGMATLANPRRAPLRTKVRCRARGPLLGCGHSRNPEVVSVRKLPPSRPSTPRLRLRLLAVAATLALATLAGCASNAAHDVATEAAVFEHPRSTTHRDGDDLLTAGLGLEGLRQMAPPAFADADAPTAAELRRRALWSSWRGIADLGPSGGYGTLYGSLAPVPGREFSAYATVPGATHPHRVLVQVPDAFDAGKRCVAVAPASGSRGIYGAIAVAGAWG